MTNAINNDNRLAVILADGNETATLTPATAIQLAADMAGHALAIADAILTAEGAVETSSKAWGCTYFNLTKKHGLDGDNLAHQSRVAMGWPNLVGQAGSKVKTRFNTLRSRCGTVAGRWDELTDDQRNELLGGIKSVNTVYDELAKADKAAKKAEDAAKAAEAKAEETDPNKAQAETVETVEFSPIDAIELLTLAMDDMTAEQMAEIQAAFAAMVNAYDAKVNSLLDVAKAA